MGTIILLSSVLIAVYGFITICNVDDEYWDYLDEHEDDFEVTYDK